MGAVTLVLAAAVTIDYWLRNRQTSGDGTARLGRRIGVLLLACYVGYYYLLFN